jgi:hypothetical protein
MVSSHSRSKAIVRLPLKAAHGLKLQLLAGPYV